MTTIFETVGPRNLWSHGVTYEDGKPVSLALFGLGMFACQALLKQSITATSCGKGLGLCIGSQLTSVDGIDKQRISLFVPGMADLDFETTLGLRVTLYGAMLPDNEGDVIVKDLPPFERLMTLRDNPEEFTTCDMLMSREPLPGGMLPDCLWTTSTMLPPGVLSDAAAIVTRFTFESADPNH